MAWASSRALLSAVASEGWEALGEPRRSSRRLTRSSMLPHHALSGVPLAWECRPTPVLRGVRSSAASICAISKKTHALQETMFRLLLPAPRFDSVWLWLMGIGGSLIQYGVFVPAFSQPMTRRFERRMVGARHVVDGTAQKTAREKLFITHNGPPPDVGPPLIRCV